MFALYDDERKLLMQGGSLLICAACAVLPFTLSPGSVAARAESLPHAASLSAPVVPERLRFPVVAVDHDPFIPDPGASSSGDDSIGIALPQSSGAPETGIVRAVVLGEHSRALIELNGSVSVVGVGDRIGADMVRSIDASGITLSSGSRLSLAVPR